MNDPRVHGNAANRRASYTAWGAGLVVFLFFELTGYERRHVKFLYKAVPWLTLSETDWAVLDDLPLPLEDAARAGLISFFTALGVHLAYKTPLIPYRPLARFVRKLLT